MGDSPNWTFNFIPTPSQWNGEFAGKMDDFPFAYSQPGTGTTLTSAIKQGGWLLDPTGELATLNVVSPIGSLDQQLFHIVTSQAIDALTVTAPLGFNLNDGGPFKLAANDVVSWFYHATNETWYRYGVTSSEIPPAAASPYQKFIPVTGGTVTIGAGIGTCLLAPAAELATLAVHLPPSPTDKATIAVSTTQVLDAVTFLGGTGGAAVIGAGPRIMTQNSGVGFIYVSGENTWYPRY